MLKLVFTLLLMGFSVGCSKQPDASTATSAPGSPAAPPTEASGANSEPATAAGNSTAASPVPQRTADLDAKQLAIVLDELTQAVRKYSFERQRLPKTFNEVVAAGYVKSVPPAPPGKRFEIDPKTVQVVLVKQ